MRYGQVVFSKKGRDKGLPFIVIDARDEYAYLADGGLRPISRPKKKKLKHIQPTNTVIDLTVFSQVGLKDADIRKVLKAFAIKEVKSIV